MKVKISNSKILEYQTLWMWKLTNFIPTVIRHLLSSPKQQTTLWPKAPDFALKHIFLCKIICNNYFLVNFIKMYSLIFTWMVGSIYWKWNFGSANFNREKLWTKNLLLSRKWGLFSKGKSNFFYYTCTEIIEIIFSTSCKKFKIFPFILCEKRRLAQGCRLSNT